MITTSGAIYSWDQAGLHRVFTSSKRAIFAAKEAKDGTQILAIADRHTVVLHDCRRNREESWGLEGDDSADHVRLLEYTNDGQRLFLSTSLSGQIQCFYIRGTGHLREVGKEHPKPPTVMAVSAHGAFMLSASEEPTVVYLQDLKTTGYARQLHPRAEEKSVIVAAFHPENDHVFLLGFKNSTLVAHKAGKMKMRSNGRVDVANALQDLNGWTLEIGRFPNLHRITTRKAAALNSAAIGTRYEDADTTSVGAKSVGIVGAAFLPGHRSRAVSVGGDGKCKIVDFEKGTVLRT